MRAILVVLALLLAGCSGSNEAVEEEDDFDDVEVDASTGGIRGVVVDEAIVPVRDATVLLDPEGESVETTTDDEGRFFFSRIEPGAHFIQVSKSLYETAQSNVVVEAGVGNPPVVKIQLERLFDEDPFLEAQFYKGHLGCAYSIPLVVTGISSTCMNDYTRIDPTGTCPGGCAPQVTGVIDQREFTSSVGAGWQSIVWELAWDSSLSGTAEELGITVSYEDRVGASHWYASQTMAQPFRMQVDVGVDGPGIQTQPDQPEQIDPEGQEDLWNMIQTGEGVAVQQDIEVFQTNFYYAPSPDQWSLLAGDDDPF